MFMHRQRWASTPANAADRAEHATMLLVFGVA
jgi:hypothetical protein